MIIAMYTWNTDLWWLFWSLITLSWDTCRQQWNMTVIHCYLLLRYIVDNSETWRLFIVIYSWDTYRQQWNMTVIHCYLQLRYIQTTVKHDGYSLLFTVEIHNTDNSETWRVLVVMYSWDTHRQLKHDGYLSLCAAEIHVDNWNKTAIHCYVHSWDTYRQLKHDGYSSICTVEQRYRLLKHDGYSSLRASEIHIYRQLKHNGYIFRFVQQRRQTIETRRLIIVMYSTTEIGLQTIETWRYFIVMCSWDTRRHLKHDGYSSVCTAAATDNWNTTVIHRYIQLRYIQAIEIWWLFIVLYSRDDRQLKYDGYSSLCTVGRTW